MVKRTLSFILAFCTLFCAFAVSSHAYSASAYILYDPDNGEIISSSNETVRKSMASTTKIMTALLLCESGRLNKIVTVSKSAVLVEGTSIGLKGGDKIARENLLYGLMLESGNDAANVIAVELAGSAKGFAIMMNEKAKKLGLNDTHYVTPSGLDDKQHYTTCRDMAKLTAFAMNNDIFRKVVGTKQYKSVYNGGKTVRTYSNHNRLLREMDGAEGVKTGFTKKSGRCLVSSCKRMNKRLIAVTLNAPDDWNDHKSLYDYGFSLYQQITLDGSSVHINDILIGGGNRAKITAYCKQISLTIKKDSANHVNYKVNLPQFIYAPVLANEKIGEVDYYLGSKKIGSADIVSADSVYAVDVRNLSVFEQIMNWVGIMLKTA